LGLKNLEMWDWIRDLWFEFWYIQLFLMIGGLTSVVIGMALLLLFYGL
jgi:hypothetical protein